MPTLLSVSRSDPVPVPAMGAEQPSSYREIIKLLAAQAPKPYGAIPPLLKKRKKKNKSRRVEQSQERKEQQKPIRRMSHVEDWIVVDSKESLPDEEELLSKSPFRNFLSADFLTQVLPLHMPPPSLSDPTTLEPEVPGKLPPALPQRAPQVSGRESPKRLHELGVQSVDDASDDEEEFDEEEEEDDDDDDEVDTIVSKKGRSRLHPKWKSDGEEEDDDAKSNGHGLVMKSSVSSSSRLLACHHELVRRHSLSSFTKAKTPSTSTTPSYVMSSSPPLHADTQQVRWMQTIAQLRKSLVLSSSLSSPSPVTSAAPPRPASKKKDGFIPMPPAPRRPPSQRRRSEATTQPRFNPETNTYTRDTRSNPDHLRMISSELNMMRARKLLSPLKPRGFLPRRKDPFVRGNGRKESRLRYEVL